MQLKVRKVGSSLGVLLPREVVLQLQVTEGDYVTMAEAVDAYRLSAYDPKVAHQVEIAKKIMRRYRITLRELAK